ncbi:alpha/beta hydrolase [Scleromatobacter humisilvae]|uniref:Alpha/beta hydrolase n=1 Tax=Scleromatobacter humisilvae TaxID=2897159 RepID=A0A9X1YJ61_9BURK|nr:alpha/beta hydrolase [Scleromatobacter humisilvae]MCK9687489.1 alpha/beta hydrolase [Scleromatobacter humisilvae]
MTERARPPDRDLLAAVDPSLRPALNPLVRWMSRRKPTLGRLPLRRRVDGLVTRIAARGTRMRWIARTDGAPALRVWIVDRRANKGSPTPAVLHLHGGGFIGTSLAWLFPTLRRLSAELDCLVVSVDYRLAPETPFPGSLEDNHAALAWLHANAASLGIDPARIAVMGESAGGGHAAALAIAARDRGSVSLACQVLLYPMLDDRTGSIIHQASPGVGAFIWSAAANVLGWSSLLGAPAGAAAPPAGAVPARVEDLRGLPPAWIGVGTLDLFFDEDAAYARRLQAAGVATTFRRVAGAYHGFDILMKDAPLAKAFTESWMDALRRAFRA